MELNPTIINVTATSSPARGEATQGRCPPDESR